MSTAFRVGDLVGQDKGDGAVQIEITHIEAARLDAKVTLCGAFFSPARLDGVRGSHGFIVGETLTFRRTTLYPDAWSIDQPSNRPWHLLVGSSGSA